jgi:hypothetical protein
MLMVCISISFSINNLEYIIFKSKDNKAKRFV